MNQPEKLLGHLVDLDIKRRRITIEIDFFDPEKQEILEILLKEKKSFSFAFWKPFRQSKSRQQLAKYYLTLHKLLLKIDEYPDSAKVKALDDEIKKRVFSCDSLEFYGKSLPLPPSKATMSMEEMSKMIQYLEENYDVILDDINDQ